MAQVLPGAGEPHPHLLPRRERLESELVADDGDEGLHRLRRRLILEDQGLEATLPYGPIGGDAVEDVH